MPSTGPAQLNRLSVRPPLRGSCCTLGRGSCTGPTAFTLIELTAVLVLMAVITGAAVVSLAGPRSRAVAADAAAQVSFADAQVRQAALGTDQPQTLLIDLQAGRLSRVSDDAPPVTLVDLPAGVRLARVVVGAEATDFGQVRLPISAAGRSPSYAVDLSTPAGQRWLVVAGLTGQVTPAADGADADAVLELTRPLTGP